MNKQSNKDRILAAARQLFAKQGFAGTSINQIEAKANVTRSLIFHYFKSKEQLWIAVKQAIVEEAKFNGATLPDLSQPFSSFLVELFERNIAFYREHADLVRMINWQRMERSENSMIGITLSAEMKAWIKAIKHYQQQGQIGKRYKPEFVVTLILSTISSIALDPNIFIQNEKDQKAYIKFCVSLLDSLS